MKLLHIDSSIFGSDGQSAQLGHFFTEQLKAQHHNLSITHRDLNADPIPHLDAETFGANLTAASERTDKQEVLAERADRLIEELLAADVLVLGVPMYNFGIPSTLKAWIDNVARAKVTFKYTENGPVGLLTGKKAIVIGARGGAYAGTNNDTQTPYLKTFLGFLGIDDVTFVYAEKMGMSDHKDDSLASAKAQLEEIANSL